MPHWQAVAISIGIGPDYACRGEGGEGV